jgi:hypothetical protein
MKSSVFIHLMQLPSNPIIFGFGRLALRCDFSKTKIQPLTPSEHAFSSGGIMATPRHSSLHPDTFSVLQIVKAGYRNGHLSTNDEAASAVPLEWVSEVAEA